MAAVDVKRISVAKSDPTSVYIPQELRERLARVVKGISNLTMSGVARRAMERWLEQVTADEWKGKAYIDGQVKEIRKPAGAPFPDCPFGIPEGRPVDSEGAPSKQLSIRFEDKFKEDLFRALAWRNEYLSHVLAKALESELDALE